LRLQNGLSEIASARGDVLVLHLDPGSRIAPKRVVEHYRTRPMLRHDLPQQRPARTNKRAPADVFLTTRRFPYDEHPSSVVRARDDLSPDAHGARALPKRTATTCLILFERRDTLNLGLWGAIVECDALHPV
jgi:hypothetical protein